MSSWSQAVLSALLAVAFLGLAYLLYRVRENRKLKERYMGAALAEKSGFRWRKDVPVLLLLGAVAMLILSFGQFRFVRSASSGTVILVMDTSNSMQRTDVLPTRLAAARQAALAFVATMPEEILVGLVGFAGEATVLVSPEGPRDQVGAQLTSVAPSGGTVIGDGLATALNELEGQWQRTGRSAGAIVLLSDGRDTGSQTLPEQAAQRAAGLEVPVFTVVLGVETSDKGGANAALLRSVAETTGAQSFTAESAEQLTGVYEQLGTQLSTDLAIGDLGPLFLFMAIVFAAAAAATVMVSLRLPEFRPKEKKRRPPPRRPAPTTKRRR
jgi:Ca-activated chloride channel family protein